MKTFRELNSLIVDWAKERELDTKGTVQGQKMKTIEELAELIIGISKDNKEIIKDSIGDVAVTLIIGNMLDWRHSLIRVYNDAREAKRSFTGKVDRVSWIINQMDMTKSAYGIIYLHNIFIGLVGIANDYDLEFLDCLESAYNEISNRKGKMINGTFVKEQDL